MTAVNSARPPGLFAQGIAKAVESASESEVRRTLLQMLACDERAFCRSAGSLLLGGELAGSRQLTQFLLRHKLLIESLASAEEYDTPKALELIRKAARTGPLLEEELEQALSALLHKAPSTVNVTRVLRVLELMAAAVQPSRLLALQHELMAYPDPKVRSKAALLTGRSAKSSASIGRLLGDEDIRVQANSVEALWSLDASSSAALLQAASKSPYNRVRGNALVGLYGIADVGSIKGMFDMAEHSDARFRSSAFWAMGSSGDSRFVPFLTGELTRRGGAERLAILKALTRIRKREKGYRDAGKLDILVSAAGVDQDGTRRVAIALRTPGVGDLSGIPATRFAVWEGAALVRSYKVVETRNPALLIAGIVSPRASRSPFARAVDEALTRCLKWKRPDDLWRLDRYNFEETPSASSPEGAASKGEQAPADTRKKSQGGFISNAEELGALIATPGLSLSGSLAALEKGAEAIRRLSGVRHLFVFFHPDSLNEWVNETRRVEPLAALIRDERLILHGIAPDDGADARTFREFCSAATNASFYTWSIETIPERMEQLYSQLLNRYEIVYRMPGVADPGEGKLVVSSEKGCGQESYALTPLPPGLR